MFLTRSPIAEKWPHHQRLVLISFWCGNGCALLHGSIDSSGTDLHSATREMILEVVFFGTIQCQFAGNLHCNLCTLKPLTVHAILLTIRHKKCGFSKRHFIWITHTEDVNFPLVPDGLLSWASKNERNLKFHNSMTTAKYASFIQMCKKMRPLVRFFTLSAKKIAAHCYVHLYGTWHCA